MADNRTMIESFQAVNRGQNGLVDPTLLPKGQASRLYNVTVRDGLARTRPVFSGTLLPFDGRFQGAFTVELESGPRLVVVVAGAVWTTPLHGERDWVKVHQFPTADFPMAYFVQAGRFCIVQNGIHTPVENWPLILDGVTPVDNLAVEFIYGNSLDTVGAFHPDNYDATGERHEPPPDPPPDPLPHVYRVPIGKAMAFGQGRLFVAVDRYWDNGIATGKDPGWSGGRGLRHILASDEEYWNDPDRMLVFTENDRLSGGGAISLPAENGFITSMTFMRNAATGTGLGEMVVLSRRGSSAFAVSINRDQWGAEGFGQQLFQSSGSSSPYALIPVNSDLVYYGDDGLRTLKYSVSGETASGGLATVPLSPEVTNFTRLTLPAHLPHVTMVQADNYIFTTAGGVIDPDTGEVTFRGVLPWDLASYQMSGEAPLRVFAGAWTGERICALFKGAEGRLGAVIRDGGLYAGSYAPSVSATGTDCVVRTGAMVFDAPRNIKRIKFADLMLDQVSGEVSVSVEWRVDGAGPWHRSDERVFRSTRPASTGTFRVPVETDNAAVGHVFEFAIRWKGCARLKLALFHAIVLDSFSGDSENMCAVTDLGLEVGRVDPEGHDEFLPGGVA